MEAEEIEKLLHDGLAGCEAQVRVDGSHVGVVVISGRFEGLNPVKQQQLVYGALNEAIADGRIHAVQMKTYTPAQWQAMQTQ